MSSEQIVLFDLPSKDPLGAWSLNPWKTRFLLNFKGLDYKTEWLEYPDVAPTLKQHIPANDSGIEYTIPTIKLPDGSYKMDSRKIATLIEEKYPEPSVRLDSAALAKLEGLMPKIMPLLKGIYMPLVPKRLLTEKSVGYWYETREKAVGMSLDQLQKEQGGASTWAAIKPLIAEVDAMLIESPDGPFFLGKDPSYVDFVWAGFLIFFKRIGEDVFEELIKTSGNGKLHTDLLEAVAPWSKRNDH